MRPSRSPCTSRDLPVPFHSQVQEAKACIKMLTTTLTELEARERAQVLGKQYGAAAATTEQVRAARAKLETEEARVRSELLGGSGLV